MGREIQGLTTEPKEVPAYQMLGPVHVKCYKGTRKLGKSVGKDLHSKIRVVTKRPDALAIFNEIYPEKKDQNGDFLLEKLNIYLPLNDPTDTFDAAMKEFDATGLKTLCDKHTIYKERQMVRTAKGLRPILTPCDRPCPLRETPEINDCPNPECKASGVLHFFIRELLDSDVTAHCRLETKSITDVKNLSQFLRQTKKEFGSLTRSPYLCFWTKHCIPFVLTRIPQDRKRPAMVEKPKDQWRGNNKEYEYTGKKSESEFWDLHLQVDPIWLDWYQKEQMVEEMRSRGLKPAVEVEADLMAGGSRIDLRTIATSSIRRLPVPAPEPSPPPASEPERERDRNEEAATATVTVIPEVVEERTFSVSRPGQRPITGAMVDQLMEVLEANGWTQNAIASLLARYQIKELSELTQEQRLDFYQIASNPQAARDWNLQTLTPPPAQETITREEWGQLLTVFEENQWRKDALMAMLTAEYGIERVGELRKEDIDDILEFARTPTVRDRYTPQS
jgi:hypothetical protein